MPHHNHNITSSGRRWHKDWRLWVLVILMLGAMAIYVLSLDESLGPRLFGY